MTIHPAMSNPFNARLIPRMAFIAHVRIEGGRLPTVHI